jgi:hypothetical protein
MKFHALVAASIVVLNLSLNLSAADVRTYQFILGDERPFRYYAETGLTGWAKIAGTFNIEWDAATNTSRITRFDAKFVNPHWNIQLSNGELPHYLIGELDDQPWSEVWPNDLTRLNVAAMNEKGLRVFGPGLSWDEFSFPATEYPHAYYFTDLTIDLDGDLAVLYGTARFRGDDGADYDLTNAIAHRVVPEPASILTATLLHIIAFAAVRSTRRKWCS